VGRDAPRRRARSAVRGNDQDRQRHRREKPAQLDEHGRLANAEQAIGELVNTGGKALFEGYYKNEAADRQRLRDGMYWTGDLAYRDADGFLYFAGRDFEWLRVDGENFRRTDRGAAQGTRRFLAAVAACLDEPPATRPWPGWCSRPA
jgi:acyl-CoA synthetase (AMP-forming)/AMP-acid ligase II